MVIPDKSKYPPICPTCGGRAQLQTLTFDRRRLDYLMLIRRAVNDAGKNLVYVPDAVRRYFPNDSTDRSYTVFYGTYQKLRFFGLIHPADDLPPGWWILTRLAGQFLRGEKPVHKKVWVYHNNILERSNETVMAKDVFKEFTYEFQLDMLEYVDAPGLNAPFHKPRAIPRAKGKFTCSDCKIELKKRERWEEIDQHGDKVYRLAEKYFECPKCKNKIQIPII